MPTTKINRAGLRLSMVLLAAGLLASSAWPQREPAAPSDPAAAPADAAVERTREQVHMLNDLYTAAFVLITTHYVSDKSTLPPGSAAVTLFDAMRQKGWHEVRLVDATGTPLFEKNAPHDEFETSAIQELKAGAPFVDRVVERDGKRYLRAAAPLAVLMEKCITCHPHYAEVEKGAPAGALAYILPID